jgi:fumarylacetoacetase
MNNTTDFSLRSWVPVPQHSDFPIQNLPYGIFSKGDSPRPGVAIGEQILDLKAVADLGFFKDLSIDTNVFSAPVLNPLIGLGKATWTELRQRLIQLLGEGNTELEEHADKVLVPMQHATMHLPVQVGDYTDFYSSIEHATNAGKMFRDPANALLPNWKHIPVGYHGRSSSIVVSGTDIHRPKGQTKPNEQENPVFGPSKALDFELEMAFIVGKNTQLGQTVSVQEAEDHIFGFVLFNDWSARDIQKWEYVPLGPFLGKNFASSVSPWIVTMEALAPFRTEGPVQDPPVLPYLASEGARNYDIKLEVGIAPEGAQETVVSRSNFRYMYWNCAQQLAHHTINGCNIRIGDMMASGTISGQEKDSFGSMLELTWSGQNPLTLTDGSTRKFINDNDTVIMRGYAEKNGVRVGFGEVRSKVLPST